MPADDSMIRAVLDSAIEAIITVGRDGRIVEFNRAAEQIFGFRREEVIGQSAVEALVPPRMRDEVMRQLIHYVKTGESPIMGKYVELPGRRADGSEFPAELAISIAACAEGDRFLTVFVRDISDRIEAEANRQKRLDERQAVYELSEAVGRAEGLGEVYEIALDALERLLGADRASVLLCDEQGVMRFVAWRNLSDDYRVMAEGHSPWPADVHSPQPILVPDVDTDESLRDLRARIRKEGICSLAFIPLLYESRLLGKFMVYYDRPHEYTDDEVHLAITIANHIAFAITSQRRAQAAQEQRQELLRHREHLAELVADRTRELERTHQQLRQTERMVMIGTLSTGLGHDMGNLLLPLRVRLDALESRGLSPETADDVRAIRTFAEYLQRLSNGLRMLALDPHEPGHAQDTTDLNEWWPDVHPVLKNAMPRGIVLEGNLDEDLPRLRIARHVLTQIVFNLVQNAGEAMKERGCGVVSVWAEQPESSGLVRLGVSDDGPGMTPEVARRCMEPFFTTKTRGISTGLGLALVHGLVQTAGGRIDVETELDKGTTFLIHLPAEPAGGGGPEAEVGERQLRAVVSLKDLRMRSHVTSVLRSLGFDVEPPEVDRPPDPGIDTWVADADPRTLRLVREFASAGEHKHAIVFGSVPRGPDFSRIIELPEKAKPSAIWRAARVITELRLVGNIGRKDSPA